MEQALAEAESDAGRQSELARAHAARSGQLELALDQTRQACIERDRRAEYLQAELDLSRSEAASRLRALAALGGQIEELRVTARGQATRIRLGALREAAEVSARIRALAGAPEEAAESMLAALEEALERLGNAQLAAGAEAATEERTSVPVPVYDPSAARPAAKSAESSELAELEAALEPRSPDSPAPEAAIAISPGSAAAPRVVAEAPSADGEQSISVDIGPFSDFSQLVSFEDAANAIGATSEISIRRFSEGRASIEVSLREPIDLLAELEANCDLRFQVRSRDAGGLILDLDS